MRPRPEKGALAGGGDFSTASALGLVVEFEYICLPHKVSLVRQNANELLVTTF